MVQEQRVNCDQCGAEMLYFEEGSCRGWRCTECDWSVVTTKMDPIWEDQTVYSLTLAQGIRPTKDTLRAVSRISGMNYLAAKKAIEHPTSPLVSGRARDIAPLKKILDGAGVPFEIDPVYPY